ncbi:MAG: hypothetical protein KF819_38120 [Labilithrix sp.]|nr:hypothetical protein [Labilithrix sp.]
MGDSLRSKLPPIYQHLMPDALFDAQAVKEPRATCDDCAMCDKGTGAPVAMSYFQPDMKCCTYFPILPNYLVGALLSDPSPELAEGQKRVRARIAGRVGVTPYFVAPPRKQSIMMEATRETGAFGRSRVLICPYFQPSEKGDCTIWKHRDAVCSTFFCKYEAGYRGYQFWSALKEYLGYAEVGLAMFSARAVDPGVVEPKIPRLKLTKRDLEDLPPTDEEYASYWGAWVGREAEFYIACHEQVKAMKKEEFAARIDDTQQGKRYLADATSRYAGLATLVVPSSLVRNPKMIERHVGESVVVTTYSVNDSFALEKDLYDVLGMFSADKTLAENLAWLEKEHGIELAPELIKYLFMHAVLVAPEPKAAETPVCATS